MTIKWQGALALAVLAAAGATAAPENKEAALFGAREGVQYISLSPDGTHVAVLSAAPNGPGTVLLVGGLTAADGELKIVLRSSGKPERLRSCRWSTDTRLICLITSIQSDTRVLYGISRYIALNADGSDVKVLSAPTPGLAFQAVQSGGRVIDWLGDGAGGGKVLMTRSYGEQLTTGHAAASDRTGLGLDRVDTTTLKREVAELPMATAREYITDGRGTLRIRGLIPLTSAGYDGATVNYQYRLAGGHEWLPFSSVVYSGFGLPAGLVPYAVDGGRNVAYGFDKQNGRQALFRVALDGSMKRELVTANAEVDVDELVQVGRENRVVGVGYATDKRQVTFFDPDLARLSQGLSKALPGLPLVDFVDASQGERQLLLWAGSDVDPGRYYLYDKTSHHLGIVLDVRPQLAGMKLAPVKPITFKAHDGASIPGYLTLPVGSSGKNLPAIVMPHGGPSARDEWGFDWLAQYFAARGFAVLQPNFRGSAGYGEGWFQHNGFQSWRTAIGDVVDGGRWLESEGIADPAKLAIIGWSYGGYAALQSAVIEPGLFKAVVAVAPVTDLASLKQDAENYSNGAAVDAAIGRGPQIREGSPAQNAERIVAPVLLFSGTLDQNVPVQQSRLMASRLKGAGKQATLVEYPGLDHQLEDSTARTDMLGRADAFLRQAMKL